MAGGPLPVKLNTIIQPLMGCLRKEGELALQRRAARAVAALLQAAAARNPSPNNKLISPQDCWRTLRSSAINFLRKHLA